MLGLLIMFMTGLRDSFENDWKKIIALSTLNQLGFIMGILCLGHLDLAFFHLLSLTHALFKALLFTCVGNLIYISVGSCQDIRYMGFLVS